VDVVKTELESIYSKVREFSISNSIYPYPTMGDFKLDVDYSPFIYDIIQKREESKNADEIEVIEDIAYNSNLVAELKSKNPWISAVNRDKILKALVLADKMEDFLNYNRDVINFIASEKTLYFDKVAIESGIEKAVKAISKDGEDTLLDNSDFKEEVSKILSKIRDYSNYL
ncbi:hypothetical protein HLB03_06920, partial [Acidianus sp. DSM 29099]|nr:hypothetical protein [Acidianus sp. RZ1]